MGVLIEHSNKVRLAHITAKLKSMCSVFSTTLTNVMLQGMLFHAEIKLAKIIFSVKPYILWEIQINGSQRGHPDWTLQNKRARWDSTCLKKKQTKKKKTLGNWTAMFLSKIHDTVTKDQAQKFLWAVSWRTCFVLLLFCSWTRGPKASSSCTLWCKIAYLASLMPGELKKALELLCTRKRKTGHGCDTLCENNSEISEPWDL